MPPAPSASKLSSARKAQGTSPQGRPRDSNRSKTGCYTCRLRRKKCDERRVGDACETCMRLKVECLGFGAKRPDWMKDRNVVKMLRERIKTSLGSKGMIKGQAGSGSRVQQPDEVLRLSDLRDMATGDYSSSSAGSPGREGSAESENPPYSYGFNLNQFEQSSIRGPDYYAPDMMSSRCDSPMDSLYPFGYPGQIEYPMMTTGYDSTPATRSRLSALYHAQFTIDDPELELDFDIMNPFPSPSTIIPSNILPDYLITDSMRYYVKNIVKFQYLLGDKVVLPEMIWEAVNRHIPSKEAVSLLSQACQANRSSYMLLDQGVQDRVLKVKEMLALAEAKFDADDAMAALHVVSLYLFDGGRGRWDAFLNFACSYTIKVLEDPRYGRNYPDALEGANMKDMFVIKTTIWFDVLASVTTLKPPRLLEYIRALFRPGLSWVPRQYSMLSPMGCENIVVWALAETSYLAFCKARSERQGTLSIRQLVHHVQEIEPWLQQGPQPIRPCDSPEGWSCYLISEIFRTSTRLYLKSVESGDHPHVPEIKDCVKDTFNAITNLPADQAAHIISPAVTRSTVFAFYICGSLTDSEQVSNTLQSWLTQKRGEEGIGNTTTISDLLRELWDERRMQSPGQPVQWRRLLRRKEILLV